jgi:hypothetical protein
MKVILVSFLLVSCTNLRHATSTNLSDIKHFRNNFETRDFWNQKVATLEAGKEANCKLLGNVNGTDNIFDQGREFAVLYMKVNAKKMGADSILVKNIRPIGDYGALATGKAYDCENEKSRK